MSMRLSLTAASLLGCTLAFAQELPKEINGRWTWAQRGVSQTFSLQNIQRKDEGSFSADLTWWTANPKCSIRSVPLTGRVADGKLSFDAVTKCDVAFTAELARADEGWKGKANTKDGVEVEISAK